VHSVIFLVSFLFCFVCILTFWRPCDTRIACLVHYYLLSFSPSSQRTFFVKKESKKPQDPKSLPNPERREKKKTVNRDRQTEREEKRVSRIEHVTRSLTSLAERRRIFPSRVSYSSLLLPSTQVTQQRKLFLFTSIRADGPLPHKRKRSCCCKMDERKRAIEKTKNNKKRWLVGCRYALHAGISLSFPIFFSVFLVVRVFVLKSSSLEARKQNKKKILSSQHRSIYTRI
jgi:hypothetical protein